MFSWELNIYLFLTHGLIMFSLHNADEFVAHFREIYTGQKEGLKKSLI
jgi:hypothetical protein